MANDTSNQAELNRRAELGRLAKRRPKKEKKSTWSSKLSTVKTAIERLETDRLEKLLELKMSCLESNKTAKVKFPGGMIFCVKINEETRHILLLLPFSESKEFNAENASNALVAVLWQHEFKLNW